MMNNTKNESEADSFISLAFYILIVFKLFLHRLILTTTESSFTNENNTWLKGKNIFAHNKKMMLICSQ